MVDSSFSKVPAAQARALAFETLREAMHGPSAGEAETGGFVESTSQPVSLAKPGSSLFSS